MKGTDIHTKRPEAIIARLESENAELRMQLESALSSESEVRRLADFRYLATMDRVNRIIQGADDLDQMMCDVLDTLLWALDCDRAFLLYPCDPESPTWHVPSERTRPEYPGACAMRAQIPMDPDAARIIRTLLDANGPVRFGPGFEPLPEEVARQFNIKSMMQVPLFPRGDKPWVFGLHQCCRDRVWTDDEASLFHTVGRRLGDGLSSLIACRQLRESEEMHRLVFDNSTDGLYLLEVTEDGRFRNLMVNRAFEAAVGIPGSELIGKFQDETVPAETAATVTAKFRRCVETGSVTTEEVELDLPVGRRVYRSILVPVWNGHGNIHRLVGITRDITERKLIEESMVAREREFRALAENCPDNIARYDAEGRFVYVNPQWERTMGVSADDVLGSTFHYEEFEEYYAKVKRVIETGCADEIDVIHPEPGGGQSYHNIRLVAERGAAGEVTGVLAIGRDITERKRMEELSQRLTTDLATTLQTIPDPLFEVDRLGTYLNVWARNADLLAQEREFLLGRTIADVLAPEAVEIILSAIHEADAQGISLGKVIKIELADGTHWFELSAAKKAGANGDDVRFIFLSRDITERKLMEEELQSKNAELERFTYTVSHDLKSPLVTIKSFAGSIGYDLASGRHDRVEKDLGRISAAAEKMTALLDDLLSLSRVGRVINASEPVDMTQLVQDVLAALDGTIKETGVLISIQPGLPTILCDRQRLTEVVQNLVENAIKYRGDQPEPSILIGLREDEGTQVFFVRDNGPGIEPQFHETIFGLFNRLSTALPGTGIGLALVKRIVEVHGGRIWVESDGQSNGSTFCFTVG